MRPHDWKQAYDAGGARWSWRCPACGARRSQSGGGAIVWRSRFRAAPASDDCDEEVARLVIGS